MALRRNTGRENRSENIMRTQIDRQDFTDAILATAEAEAALAAWTLEELDDDLGSLREASAMTSRADVL
jgi:hypothetical protein